VAQVRHLLVLAAAGSMGPRRLIRDQLLDRGLVEGSDWGGGWIRIIYGCLCIMHEAT